MFKKINKIALMLVFVMLLSSFSFAAEFTQSGSVKTPISISFDDLTRLQEVANASRGGSVRIVNATSYNNSKTVWAVRMEYTNSERTYLEDYVITVYPYSYDDLTKEVTSLPFKTVEEGTAMFGPCWYYFGLFDKATHNTCGFGIAERVKRWSSWNDQSFSGVTYRGVSYTGAYPQSCNDFVASLIS